MKTKELQIVSYEQAVRLRYVGFDWNTTDFYHESGEKLDNHPNPQDFNECDCMFSAPSVALALKWAADEKDIQNGVCISISKKGYYGEYCDGYCDDMSYLHHVDGYQKNKDEAESALLDALLTYLEKGNEK